MKRTTRVPVIVALSAVAACAGHADGGRPADATVSRTVSAAPYLETGDRWAPAAHRDGDLTVMPVTFPDGTTAELAYPPDLGLEDFSVYPDTYASGGPRVCGWPVHATRYDPAEGWVTGDRPLTTFERPDGRVAELWEGERSHEPIDYLLIRFGAWTVIVSCQWTGDAARDEFQVWADNIGGHESLEGLLVLTGAPPLEMHPGKDRDGPTIRISSQDLVLDLTVGPKACGWDVDDRDVRGDGTVQWCIEPDGGIWFYATAFTPDGRDFLEQVVAGLDVRDVRAPAA